MSTERSGKSHGTAWLACIILALPVVYRLSVPLVVCVAYSHSRHDRYYWRPDWLRTYQVPAGWIDRWPPLEKALFSYDMWIRKRMSHLNPEFDAFPYYSH
jgi:hypothetical protein